MSKSKTKAERFGEVLGTVIASLFMLVVIFSLVKILMWLIWG